MSWIVKYKAKTARNIRKLPANIQLIVEELDKDIKKSGPIQPTWPNYSRLTDGHYHCHLNYSYVAVWKVVDHVIEIVEITYVGSRENAPY